MSQITVALPDGLSRTVLAGTVIRVVALAASQAIVRPTWDRRLVHAASARDRLKTSGLRADLGRAEGKIGYKMREAQLQTRASEAARTRQGWG